MTTPKKETRAARAERLAKRNARQRAYRAQPGRAAAEALASRQSYYLRTRGLARPILLCRCDLCAQVGEALAKPYRPRGRAC